MSRTPNDRVSGAPSVLLVSLPWTDLEEPSLGLGLLKAVLNRAQIPCRVMHLNLFLLQHLQANTYRALAESYALNDFLFSGILDPIVTNTQRRWLRTTVEDLICKGGIDKHRFGGSEGAMEAMLRLRRDVLPAWLGKWADEIARHDASLVGYTCMFDQTIASLALARLVRERAPGKMMVLGGYAARAPTSEMILRSSAWIDAVCEGEGEVTLVALARAAAGEIPLDAVPGITFRSKSGEISTTPPPPPVDLSANPSPDYDDFFADLRRLSEEHEVKVKAPFLPIENSRGCWWGAKSHCTFCGIRDEDMAYRARAPEKVMETMAELEARYGNEQFRFADYIMPIQYFATLLPELARRGRPYRLHAEMKANITAERFALLARAGFVEVQLGIESFSSDALRKMKKGVTAAQNVHSLVQGRRFGLRVAYNLLYGFPDDEEAEYEHLVASLPHLVHLDPPLTCLPVLITRFAPLQTRPGQFGIGEAVPDPRYDLVFSRDHLDRTGFDVAAYCYYFSRPFENAPRLRKYYERMDETCIRWRRLSADGAVSLYGVDDGDGLTIHDGRSGREVVYPLGAPRSTLLAQCERPISMPRLLDANPSLPNVPGLVAELEELGLLFRDEARLVSVVLPDPTADRAATGSFDVTDPSATPQGVAPKRLPVYDAG